MEKRRSESVLIGIAIFKLVKALLLIAVGVGALRLLHRDVAEVVLRWVNALHVDPYNRYVNRILAKAFSVNHRQLAEIGLGTFAYAAVFLAEGTSLLLRKRWAEYFTAIVTASFVPLEIIEAARRFTALRVAVILINVGIVLYLAARIRSERGKSAPPPHP